MQEISFLAIASNIWNLVCDDSICECQFF